MLILSKYKDYYDWVVFETDNRKVYIRETIYTNIDDSYKVKLDYRKPQHHLLAYEGSYIGTVYFCNNMYKFLFHENQYYWHDKDVSPKILKDIANSESNKYGSYYRVNKRIPKNLGLIYKTTGWNEKPTIEAEITDINKILNCPVVITKSSSFILNPKLSEINFNKLLTPEQVYQEIYNWIPYVEPELPGGPDDMSRYEAKGFDKKTSFRPKMK